ncbi:hypothetical protein L210DRAFT_3614939 [Boletus edulis BED1]|uniref:Uncharacterized protein n=1 Tax=Boletus edulis BED1 TaxID=1328754 RepID=A0AAD4BFH0_BOLED|nr:hypothetical protein L210DRAFT_3614939 [Boletus edulis BED1]
MPSKRTYHMKNGPGEKIPCRYCNKEYTQRGLKSHESSCASRLQKKAREKEFAELSARVAIGRLKAQSSDSERSHASIPRAVDGDELPGPSFTGEQDHLPFAATANAAPDSFKTEYHPKSGRATEYESFSCYGQQSFPPSLPDDTPWAPFLSRLDFEIAELTHQSAMSKDQAWSRVASRLTPLQENTISVPYKQETLEFEVYTRPLWEWALDLLEDPLLAPHFVWDAQRLYKHDGTRFERFIHEPWTADRWWDIQVSITALPGENSTPFALILYADKSHLTASGHVKAYPVIARCANLPVNIRNGDGLGGGRVVGFLPIVPGDAAEDGKLSYTDLKRVVWHESFLKLLESIIELSKVGFAYKCFDEIIRVLYPIILILSADYEEQRVMALIRGMRSHCPCPCCLVPRDKLRDHATNYRMRTSEDAIEHLRRWETDRVTGEEALKDLSLRPVENTFWRIKYSDPHRALSFDPLHTDDHGMWGSHLFSEVKMRLQALGRDSTKKVDDQHSQFPRWRKLMHFKAVTNIHFTDGNQFLDIAKQVLFTTQNVLTREADRVGYSLLKTIAAYLQYHMYLSLEVQTETTIAAAEEQLLKFQQVLGASEYISLQGENLTKNWNFPKSHLAKHAPEDIRQKGAVRNFSTRPNEKQHGPIRRAYLRQTNRKEASKQVWNVLHEQRHNATLRLSTLEDAEGELDEMPAVGHTHLGSPQKPTTLGAVEQEKSSNQAFRDFHNKFVTFINQFAHAHNIPLPNGEEWFVPTGQAEIQEFWYLKVNYESAVDWRLATDYLRCNPSFHGNQRYDCVLISTQDRHGNTTHIFARLLMMFRYVLNGNQDPLDLALVQPMDAPTGNQCVLDHDLGFTRLRARPTARSEFISLRSVVRGALLVPDFRHAGDFFLVDYVDGDWFLRAKQLR